MATYHGFGTIYYGKRDFGVDGSYVTTLWIVVAYVPVVPVRSVRMRDTGGSSYFSMDRRRHVVLLAKMKPVWTQVVSVYAFFVIEVGLIVAADRRFSPDPWKAWGFRALAAVLVALPLLLQKRARERVKAQLERMEMGFSPEFRDGKVKSFRD
jgi:hypothetical protein